MNNNLLYFPSIEFRNDAWVKTSLLLWDCIYRIKPGSYTPHDSNEINEAEAEGYIRNIVVEKVDIQTACGEFINFLRNLPFLPAGFDDIQYEPVHEEKIDSVLYPLLEAIAEKYENHFFHLPRQYSRGYMYYLSNIVAKRRSLVRATDDYHSWIIMPYFTEQANFGENVYDEFSRMYYASIIMKDVLPLNAGCASMKDIIQFVSKRKDERECFRNTLNEFTSELSLINNQEHALALVNDYEKKLREAKTDLRKSMDFCNSTELNSLLTVGLPISATAILAFSDTGNPYSLAKILGFALIGAVAAYSDYKKVVKDKRRSNMGSYLLDIDEMRIRQGYIPNLSYTFNEFMND